MLEEHQSVLELIMNKYRQQVKKINETTKAEKVWAQKDFSLVINFISKIHFFNNFFAFIF